MAAKAKAAQTRVKATPASDKLAEMGIEAVCDRIADCRPLHAIASEVGVSKGTLIEWLGNYADQYTRAKQAQADRFAEDILRIADTPQIGVKTKTNEKGEVETIEGDMIEHRRLQVDARKWLASKFSPKKYGEKITHAADPENPLVTQLVVTGAALADKIKG